MTYIENVFLCMASPLLIAALCMGKRQRKFFLFCFAGMGVCLLSAVVVLAANLVTDILYAIVNPAIQYD